MNIHGRPAHAIACALPLAALAAGCGLDRIDVTVEEETTVPGSSLPEQLLGDVGFPGFSDFDITESRTFQNEGYTENDIDSVFTDSFELEIVAPPDGSFDFLNSIRFTARAEGLPDVDIAWLDPIPEGATELALEVDPDLDLQPYVVAPEMTIETTANGNRPSQETTIGARIVFEVEIKVF
jgi:hypothetical protein